MSSFQRATRKFSDTRRAAIENALEIWSDRSRAGRVVATNLNPLEHFLPAIRMRRLLLVILESIDEGVEALEEAYRKECYRHVLRGGLVKANPVPKLVGRAVERDSFVNHLFLNCGGFFSRVDLAEDFLIRLLVGDSLSEAEQELPLSPYSAWVTWNEQDSEADPFDFASDSSDRVRSSLGLDPERRCREGLLLLVYSAEDGLRLLRPTVADANLFLYFQPPYAGFSGSGKTKPWLGQIVGSGFKPEPRPEAVHRRAPMRLIAERGLRLLP